MCCAIHRLRRIQKRKEIQQIEILHSKGGSCFTKQRKILINKEEGWKTYKNSSDGIFKITEGLDEMGPNTEPSKQKKIYEYIRSLSDTMK